jgi:hypothetical protein
MNALSMAAAVRDDSNVVSRRERADATHLCQGLRTS